MSLIDGLLANWHMNNNWLDSKGAYHGTAYGAVFGSPKLGSHAGSFDGTDDYVAIPTLNAGNVYSIGFWANFESLLDKNPMVIDKLFHVAIWFSKGYPVKFLTGNGVAWDGVWKSGNTVIQANAFYNVVITVNGTSIQFFLNGAPDGTGTRVDRALNVDLKIGGRPGAGSGYFFPGRIDEVAIWNRVLTEAEVAEFWNGGAGLELGGAVSGRRRRMMLREAYV